MIHVVVPFSLVLQVVFIILGSKPPYIHRGVKVCIPEGMCTYGHSYYISCSYVGLSSGLKKPIVIDESLSASINPMFCYDNTFNYS